MRSTSAPPITPPMIPATSSRSFIDEDAKLLAVHVSGSGSSQGQGTNLDIGRSHPRSRSPPKLDRLIVDVRKRVRA